MTFLLLCTCTSILLLSGNVVAALQCHTCADVDRHTGKASLTCDDFYLKNHTRELLQGCGEPPSGHTVRCTKFGGQAKKVEPTGATIIMDGVARGCVVLKEDSLPRSRCYHGEEASPWLPSLVPGSEGASVNGLICFCEDAGCNGVVSVQPFAPHLLFMLMALYALL
ncbi:uncharacterized protein LOC110984933 [Acanthaster planci]|uniref:Uncharacterized protein LOC110984933 n=1 Tax=Acanthaster planci TaxID=133434 RepID=A0A8B7Z8Y7_ACAPL|nr:uncharacterized protein LOC110984933 [Acanthaster planci]XP_022101271.1 uncharacterized protein LOC110984933 [Acanthaster planci]XP_022101272.1 uncharacterized protein LOC110984933 [Acanthaster planci]